MNQEIREGYYQDQFGNWHPDRRKGPDRRNLGPPGSYDDHERRKLFRRKADRELFERDHREMIKDALDDFAEKHNGRL